MKGLAFYIYDFCIGCKETESMKQSNRVNNSAGS